MKYRVTCEHTGDKYYRTGDIREANPQDVKHPIAAGILVETTTKTEKAIAPKTNKDNKAEAEKRPYRLTVGQRRSAAKLKC